MEMILLIQYVWITAAAYMLVEYEIKNNPASRVGYLWCRCNRFERIVACMLPLYREFIILYIVWNRR